MLPGRHHGDQSACVLQTAFDTAKDFAPVGKIGDATLVLVVNPGVPVKGLADVIALSKTQPGGSPFGTSGTGGTPTLLVSC